VNASRQPDRFCAGGDFILGKYRKMNPGPLEEFISSIIRAAATGSMPPMRWKAEKLAG